MCTKGSFNSKALSLFQRSKMGADIHFLLPSLSYIVQVHVDVGWSGYQFSPGLIHMGNLETISNAWTFSWTFLGTQELYLHFKCRNQCVYYWHHHKPSSHLSSQIWSDITIQDWRWSMSKAADANYLIQVPLHCFAWNNTVIYLWHADLGNEFNKHWPCLHKYKSMSNTFLKCYT